MDLPLPLRVFYWPRRRLTPGLLIGAMTVSTAMVAAGLVVALLDGGWGPYAYLGLATVGLAANLVTAAISRTRRP